MKKISQREAFSLNKLGIKFGENGISSKNKKYYLCESKQNLAKLEELHKSHITTYTNEN